MKLENSYAQAFPDLALEALPYIPAGSKVAWVNEPLARELGLDPAWLSTAEGLKWLIGSGSETFALGYSGFQFGNLSPVLGDGRAHLVGELPASGVGKPGLANRVDVHLKGSGLTPFSRPGADGKAPLSAVWREVVIGEFFAATGVPTSRALAVLETDEKIQRREPSPEPAGILVRVAASHLRVGTFQYAQMKMEEDERAELVDYALERHYPKLVDEPGNSALKLLRAVTERQADLVAQWMGLGFVHGVLNTDNVAISGESIDFGPCAFLDEFRFNAVFSSIDRQGRYAFRNQPAITQWNLARFAETILDLIDGDPNRAVELASGVLEEFEGRFQSRWTETFAAKLGVKTEGISEDSLMPLRAFIGRTLNMLETEQLDFTVFFRRITEEKVEGINQEWLQELAQLRQATDTPADLSRVLMEGANPLYIPRNARVDAVLKDAANGNLAPMGQLIAALRSPYHRREGLEALETAPDQAIPFVSFCGT